LNTVGIQLAYNIVMQYQKFSGLVSPLLKKMMMPYNLKAMASVLKKMLDEGKLGESSGEGFFNVLKMISWGRKRWGSTVVCDKI
jgi:hypothetical protein